MKKPIIGITLDSQSPGGYSKMPWYALRQNYCDVVVKSGGIPKPLAHYCDLVSDYVKLIDGLIITGGNFDIDPSYYGESTLHETVTTKPSRTNFEFAMIKAVHEAGKPILGICGGMQLLNVFLGGSLIQHIPAEIDNSLAHEQPNPRTEPGHEIVIKPDSLLFKLVNADRAHVNSAHHQAVKAVAPGMRVTATAIDGVIEAIEPQADGPFMLGVQWHPEYEVCDLDREIFNHFIQRAARG